jgi:hypothetical protein
MIQRFVSKLLVMLMVLSASAIAIAKVDPYSVQFEQQVQQLFLDNTMKVSATKTDAYINRLETKKRQIGSLIANAERQAGNSDEAKISKKVADADSLKGLDVAILQLQRMKKSADLAQVYDLAKMALDIEGSIRIDGEIGDPIESIVDKVGTTLGEWKLPKNSSAADEATNLYDPRTQSYLSQQEIANLKAQGADLSLYGPGPSSPFWNKPASISNIDVNAAGDGKLTPLYRTFEGFPTVMNFDYKGMKHTNTKPKMDVTWTDAQGNKHKLKFKLSELHADPTVSSLMQTLGYPQDLTRYIRHVRINLGNQSFSDMKRDWEDYFKRDGWHSWQIENYIESQGTDAKGQQYVIFKDGLIEAKPDTNVRLGGWRFGENKSFREVRALLFLQLFFDNNDIKEFDNNLLILQKDANGEMKRYMEIADPGRSLGGFMMENPDMFQWDVISGENSKEFKFYYRGVHQTDIKNKMTLADVKWATRLLSGLTRKQFEAAVARGNWPACMQKIYVEKLIARRNALVRHLGLTNEIALMPETQNRAQYDKKANLCQTNLVDIKANYSSDFDQTMNSAYELVAKTLRDRIYDLAGALISGKRRYVWNSATINTKDFKNLNTRYISEVILNFSREIEQNPKPKTEQDLYIVEDTFELGFRLGVEFGAFKDIVYTRKFSLSYPVRSYSDARLHNGFVVNLMLARDIAKNQLPDQYVLKTEHYLENGVGIAASTDLITAPLLGMLTLKLKTGIARINLWRSMLDHRDENRVILYRDRSDWTQAHLDGSFALSLLRFKVFTSLQGWGQAAGYGQILTKADLDNPVKTAAVGRAVVDGDFDAIHSSEKEFALSDDFRISGFKWNLLFVHGNTQNRLDNIQIATNGQKGQNTLEYRTTKEKGVGFITDNKTFSKSVEVYLNPKVPGDIRINVRVIGSNIDTRDNDLSTYIGFINSISPNNARVIDFSPNLGYSTNGRWGMMVASSETEYSPQAVYRILTLTAPQLRGQVAASKGMGANQYASVLRNYQEYRQAELDEQGSVAKTNPDALMKEFGLDRDQIQLIQATENFVHNLKKANSERTLDKKVQLIAEALRNSLFVNKSGFYDPTILKAMNRVAGLQNVYSRNVLTKPPFDEEKTIEAKPIYGEFGTRSEANDKYLIFTPQSPVELYTMFDTWF